MSKYDTVDFYFSENQTRKIDHIKAELIFGDLNRPIPKYTIVIATYRRYDLLEKSLISVLKQKKIKDYEIIVAEHGQENDDIEKMLKKYQKHKNLFYYKLSEWIHYGVWNKSLDLVRSKWFTILCDDDLLSDNYLYAVDNILKNYPEAEAVSASFDAFFSETKLSLTKKIQSLINHFKNIFHKKNYYIGKYCIDNYLTRNGTYSQHTIMYKKDNIYNLGGWDIKYFAASDMIINANYILKYNMFYTTEILGSKREGQGNYSNQKFIKTDSISLTYSFFKSLKSKLKYLKFDDNYIKLCIANITLRDGKLRYEDLEECNLDIPKEYFTEEYLFQFRQSKEEYLKQLNEYEPAISKYHYDLMENFNLIKEKCDIGINFNMDLANLIKDPKNKKRIFKMPKKYANKKILLYGAGIFADMIFQTYDLSELNIIAVADLEYQYKKEFRGIKVISPEEIKKYNFDTLLIAVSKPSIVKDYLSNILFKDKKIKLKIDSLIK